MPFAAPATVSPLSENEAETSHLSLEKKLMVAAERMEMLGGVALQQQVRSSLRPEQQTVVASFQGYPVDAFRLGRSWRVYLPRDSGRLRIVREPGKANRCSCDA